VRFVPALIVVLACKSSQPSERELIADAQDQTRTFFALGEGGDCERLAGMMLRPAGCAELVKQFKDTHAHLSKIEGAKLDGRDKETVLVSVEATAPEHVHHWIVRAKWTTEGWKLAL
jgi:hypothetical protein